MFTFLLVVQAIIAALLVTVILMQRSEGGGLTTGGSPSGLMSARGASDFLTKSTAVLATVFVAMSITLAVFAANRQSTTIDTSLARQAPVQSQQGQSQQGTSPADQDALKAAAAAAVAQGNATAPVSNSGVPLQQ